MTAPNTPTAASLKIAREILDQHLRSEESYDNLADAIAAALDRKTAVPSDPGRIVFVKDPPLLPTDAQISSMSEAYADFHTSEYACRQGFQAGAKWVRDMKGGAT